MDILSVVLGPIASIINKMIPDKDLALKLNAELQAQATAGGFQLATAQAAANAAEGTNASMFVAGWRPFIGWVCGIGLAYNTVFLAVLKSIFALLVLVGVDPAIISKVNLILPQIDMTLLGNILTQMLGMGFMSYLRTQEKIAGVSRDRINDQEDDE